MKTIRYISSIVWVALLLTGCTNSTDKELQEAFTNPPQDARPRVWWHWEDGNVTISGIRADLEWMKRIGVGGFHHFDAALSTKPIVEKRLIYMDDGWRDAFRIAVGMADSMGMEVGIASSPGWSSTGGPWVTDDDAMKHLVWSTVELAAGETFDGVLPEPNKNLDYYRDIAVVAVKTFHSDDSVRSVKVIGAQGRSMWANAKASYDVSLEAKTADGWQEVTKIPSTTAGNITVNIPATFATEYRMNRTDGGKLPEFILYHTSRVEHSEEKTGFCSPFDMAEFPTAVQPGERFPEASETQDLTTLMTADGTLHWTAPDEGDGWRILRLGYTLTGKRNGPAPAEATGLEVDKLDAGAWSRYFHHYLDMYVDASQGLLGQRGIEYLLVDSYEAHWQTWTCRMAEEFESRRGYALLPWLPALTGEIMCSAEDTERFLFDWRRTIGELYAENYARLQEYAKEYGLKGVYLESHENGRVYVVDGMDVKRHATIPMAACWTPVNRPTSHSTIPMAIADIRESASVAHFYGKPHVAAESFTADGWEGDAYSFTPARLKEVADVELASGVNQFFIHECSHQPLDDCRPGLGLLGYGQWFNRHETWAEQAGAWMDYLARSSALLSMGENVADVLVYYGEDTNATARYGLEPFQIPTGYNYDFINPSGLFELKVMDGRLVAPSGASYAVLCKDTGHQPSSPEVEERLEELVRQGAVVCTKEQLATTLTAVPADIITDKDIRFVHRRVGETDVYWVNKPSSDYRTVMFDLRTSGLTPSVWNPVTGQMSAVSYQTANGRTTVTFDMEPDDAQFIVFGKKGCGLANAVNHQPWLHADEWLKREADRAWDITWSDTLRTTTDTLFSYPSSSVADVRYFAGTAVYRTTLSMDDVPAQAFLDLGKVCDLAEVEVNGVNCGTLWKAPFATSVADALRKGDNELTIRVTNVWVNRLIGDKQPDCLHPCTYTSAQFYSASSSLLPAGLLGPVVLYEKKN